MKMANSGRIIKVQLGTGFTVIPNSVAQSKELSLEEKGLLLFLNSLPENFVIYKSNLHQIMGELEGTVDRVFKSLRLKGYIASEKTHKDNGDFEGWQHRFSLDPKDLLATPTNSEVAESTPIKKKEDTSISIYIKETYPRLVSFYNSLFERQSRGCKKSTSQYSARIKDGYKIEDFENALKALHEDSFHKETNYKYATLEFITRTDKLERFMLIKPNPTVQTNTTESRYWSLIEIIKQRPLDNGRFTYDERKFIMSCQQTFDRFPPEDRKLVSDTCSLTRAELNEMEARQNG